MKQPLELPASSGASRTGKKIAQGDKRHPEENGLLLREGTIVDATIIDTPSSTKNNEGERDPDMQQTRKGKQWHFGTKMHIGVDESLSLIHCVETTAVNEADINMTDKLLHGKKKNV
jgi:IS5 family transposase